MAADIAGIATAAGTLINGAISIANHIWGKKAQKTQWDREDNAVQRRALDYKRAGMSPHLAAGQAAQTGEPIKAANEIDASGISDSIGVLGQLGKLRSEIGNTEADTALKKQQVDASKKNMKLHDAQMDQMISQQNHMAKQNEQLDKQIEIMRHGLAYAYEHKIPYGQSDAIIRRIEYTLDKLLALRNIGGFNQGVFGSTGNPFEVPVSPLDWKTWPRKEGNSLATQETIMNYFKNTGSSGKTDVPSEYYNWWNR